MKVSPTRRYPTRPRRKSLPRVGHEEEALQDSTCRNGVFSQVVEPERHDRVQSYGLGPTPNSLWGSSSTLGGRSASEFTVMTNKLQQMEEQMKLRDVEILELRSMIQTIYSRQVVQGPPIDPASG